MQSAKGCPENRLAETRLRELEFGMGPWSDTWLSPASHHLSRKLPALPNRTPGVLFFARSARAHRARTPARVASGPRFETSCQLGAIPPKRRHAIAKVGREF